jgi:hypothetical protein
MSGKIHFDIPIYSVGHVTNQSVVQNLFHFNGIYYINKVEANLHILCGFESLREVSLSAMSRC